MSFHDSSAANELYFLSSETGEHMGALESIDDARVEAQEFANERQGKVSISWTAYFTDGSHEAFKLVISPEQD